MSEAKAKKKDLHSSHAERVDSTAMKVQLKSLKGSIFIENTAQFLSQHLKILLIGALILVAGPVKAEDPDDPPLTIGETFVKGNIQVSEWFDSVADGIDLFLAGNRLTRKKNETYVRIENSYYLREGESEQTTSSINANLRLPNVEEYWQLKFTSYDESRERRISQTTNLRRTPREQNYGATVGLFQKLGNVRAAFQPRIALQDRFKISNSVKFESVADLVAYKVNPKLEFFGDADEGAGIYSAINVEFRLSKIWNLTVFNDGEYKDRPHIFTVTNGVSFGQVINERSALSYDFVVDSNNREAYHLESYSAAIGYSQLIYHRILDYSIAPNVVFPRADDFQPSPGIAMSLNVTF